MTGHSILYLGHGDFASDYLGELESLPCCALLARSAKLAIPDNAPFGLRRVLTLNSASTVKRMSVDIDIAHTFIQDLSVRLTAPDGTEVVLHNRSGGNSDNIIRTYSPENTFALQALRGKAIDGDWTLHVRDHENADIGKLNRWALKVEQD